MKGFHNILVSALLFAFLFLPIALAGRHISRPRTHHGNHHHHHHHSAAAQPRTKESMVANPSFYRDRWPAKRRGPGPGPRPRPGPGPDTVQIAGSSLPDCSHACGSCSPCRLVMVSFVCASLEEAETCPMAYKCMCHNKSFPVP